MEAKATQDGMPRTSLMFISTCTGFTLPLSNAKVHSQYTCFQLYFRQKKKKKSLPCSFVSNTEAFFSFLLPAFIILYEATETEVLQVPFPPFAPVRNTWACLLPMAKAPGSGGSSPWGSVRAGLAVRAHPARSQATGGTRHLPRSWARPGQARS